MHLLYLFHLYRLKKGKQLEKEEAISEVKKNIHLIKAPHAGKNFLDLSHQPIYAELFYFHVQGITDDIDSHKRDPHAHCSPYFFFYN